MAADLNKDGLITWDEYTQAKLREETGELDLHSMAFS